MLRYKALRYGASVAAINEGFSTQVCSECRSIGGPKGIADLGMRQWTCSDCGAVHDRDVNAARNLLVFAGAERRPLAGEIPVLKDGKTLSERHLNFGPADVKAAARSSTARPHLVGVDSLCLRKNPKNFPETTDRTGLFKPRDEAD